MKKEFSKEFSETFEKKFGSGGFEINTINEFEEFKNDFIEILAECIKFYKLNAKEIEEVGIKEYFDKNL